MKDNFFCKCGHRKSRHNARQWMKKSIKEDWNKQTYHKYTFKWYMNTADRLYIESQCNGAQMKHYCPCEKYERDNLKYLESLV